MKIFVAGHTGLVGSALMRRLQGESAYEVITVGRQELDLRDGAAVVEWLERNKPDGVIVAAGTVGGIKANSTRPADFLWDNVTIACNVINGSWKAGVRRLMYLSSNCVFPREMSPPHTPTMIGTGPMETTNEWYGYSKIVGMKLCDAYRLQHGADFFSVIPTSTFGPGDSLIPGEGHVIPDLIMKSVNAATSISTNRKIQLWGTGTPVREYLFVDDLASALVFAFERYRASEALNIGGGHQIRIADLARLVADLVDPAIEVEFDESKPDGAPTRYLDNSVLEMMGWRAASDLRDSLAVTIAWYREHLELSKA